MEFFRQLFCKHKELKHIDKEFFYVDICTNCNKWFVEIKNDAVRKFVKEVLNDGRN
jgi:hypothetical protein